MRVVSQPEGGQPVGAAPAAKFLKAAEGGVASLTTAPAAGLTSQRATEEPIAPAADADGSDSNEFGTRWNMCPQMRVCCAINSELSSRLLGPPRAAPAPHKTTDCILHTAQNNHEGTAGAPVHQGSTASRPPPPLPPPPSVFSIAFMRDTRVLISPCTRFSAARSCKNSRWGEC